MYNVDEVTRPLRTPSSNSVRAVANRLVNAFDWIQVVDNSIGSDQPAISRVTTKDGYVTYHANFPGFLTLAYFPNYEWKECENGFLGGVAESYVDGNDDVPELIGLHAMAMELGFENTNDMLVYFAENPDIWGNASGYDMAYESDAFGDKDAMSFHSVHHVADFLHKVAIRLQESERG